MVYMLWENCLFFQVMFRASWENCLTTPNQKESWTNCCRLASLFMSVLYRKITKVPTIDDKYYLVLYNYFYVDPFLWNVFFRLGCHGRNSHDPNRWHFRLRSFSHTKISQNNLIFFLALSKAHCRWAVCLYFFCYVCP